MEPALPQRLFSESKNKLQYIKDNLSLMFDDIGGYIINATNEITSFKGKMKPFAHYFYPVETDPGRKSFLSEVVFPCREETENVIKNILEMLKNNEQTREGLDVSIVQFNTLQSTVRELVSVLGEIRHGISDMGERIIEPGRSGRYSETIISARDITPVIDELCLDFNGMIEEFNSIHKVFFSIKDWISREHEDYLSNIRKRTGDTFEELVKHIHSSSGHVNELLKHLDNVVSIIREIINNLQMEDIERQNLEKIIFFMDEFANDYSGIYNSLGEQLENGKLDEVVLSVMRDKLLSVKGRFSELITGLNDCFEMLANNLQDGLKYSSIQNGAGTIGDIYRDIESLEKEFLDHVGQVKDMIKDLNMLFHRIFNLKRKFGMFLFKVKNVSTVLDELCSPGEGAEDAKQWNGGLAKNLKNLKEIIEKTAGLYNEINYRVGVSVLKNHENLTKQEDILQEAIFSIKKVSSKLLESKTYYFGLSEEIRKNSKDILEFISREDRKMSNLRDTDKTIGKINSGFGDFHKFIGKENMYAGASHYSEITSLKTYFEETGEKGDYKNMMLVSLLSEYCELQSEEEVEFF